MRAATEAAWLQVKAPREQLEVLKAVAQFVVAVLRHVTVRDGKCAFASHAAVVEHGSYSPHFLLSCKMGNILEKLFKGDGPVVENDSGGSCTSKCCDTAMISEVSSSSSEHTHASRHAHSRPSFDTLPPGQAEMAARDKVPTK